MFEFTYLSVQKAVQNCNNKTLRRREKKRKLAVVKNGVAVCLTNDGTIWTNFSLRQEVHHALADLWEILPGDSLLHYKSRILSITAFGSNFSCSSSHSVSQQLHHQGIQTSTCLLNKARVQTKCLSVTSSFTKSKDVHFY